MVTQMFGKFKSLVSHWWVSSFGTAGNPDQNLATSGVKRPSVESPPSEELAADANIERSGPSFKRPRLAESKNGKPVKPGSKLDLERNVQRTEWSQMMQTPQLQKENINQGRKLIIEGQQAPKPIIPEFKFQSPEVKAGEAKQQEQQSSLHRLEEFMTLRLGDGNQSASKSYGLPPPRPVGFGYLQKWKKDSRHSSQYSGLTNKSNLQSPEDKDRRRQGVSNGGIQKLPAHKSIYEKLYGGARSQKRDLIVSTANQFSSWAIQSCFRMEDKLSYKNLLSQFAPKLNNSGTGKFSSIATPPSSRSPLLSPDKLSQSISKSLNEVKKETPEVVIDLEGPEWNEKREETVPAAPSTPLASKAVARINSLEEALVLSPQYDVQFVPSIKSRFGAKERERQRLVEEEKLRAKILSDNREEWENQIEERLRKQLEIVPGRAVLDERREVILPLPEITDKMETVISDAMRPHPETQVLCDAFNLTITRRDIASLTGLNWLNDQVINFYFTLIMERSKNSQNKPKVYAFNTFFYPKLMSGGHSVLKRWTRKVDLFDHDLILIPVHLGIHWCVSVVAVKEQVIRYYDSMGGKNHNCLDALKRYMEAESLDKRKTALDTSGWKMECVEDIPQQMNGSDCGMFACKYADYISRRSKITFTQKDMPYFRRRMVYEIITQQLIEP